MFMTRECNAQLTQINQAWWRMQPTSATFGGCSLPFEKWPLWPSWYRRPYTFQVGLAASCGGHPTPPTSKCDIISHDHTQHSHTHVKYWHGCGCIQIVEDIFRYVFRYLKMNKQTSLASLGIFIFIILLKKKKKKKDQINSSWNAVHIHTVHKHKHIIQMRTNNAHIQVVKVLSLRKDQRFKFFYLMTQQTYL